MSFNLIPAYYVIVCILANKCSAVTKIGRPFGHNRHGPKIGGGGSTPFWVWGAGSPCNTMWPGPRPTFVPSGILIVQPFGNNRHGPKIGGLCLLFGDGSWVPSNRMSLGLRPTSLPSGIFILPAVWPQQIWAENWGGLCPFGGGRTRSPSNTVWPGPRPTFVPSFILIHPTVWPQHTNVIGKTDIGPIALGEPFYKRSPNKTAME